MLYPRYRMGPNKRYLVMQRIIVLLTIIGVLFAASFANASPGFSEPYSYWDDISVQEFGQADFENSNCRCDWFRALTYYNARVVNFYHSENGIITDVQQIILYNDGYVELISVNGLGEDYIIIPTDNPYDTPSATKTAWKRIGTRQTGEQVSLTPLQGTIIRTALELAGVPSFQR